MACCMCCGQNNKVSPLDEDDLPGGDRKRSCTDIVCLLLFATCIGGMAYIGYSAWVHGDPYRLLNGWDSWGNTCGRQNRRIDNVTLSGRDLTAAPKLFHFTPTAVVNPAMDSARLCVSSCPNTTLFTLSAIKDFENLYSAKLCQYDKSQAEYTSTVCPDLPVTTHVDVLNRCVPEAAVDVGTNLIKSVSSGLSFIPSRVNCSDGDFFQKFATDVERSWKDIAYLCAVAFGVGLVMTILMRFFAGPVIWTSIIVCALGSLAAAAVCWWHWYEAKQDLETNAATTQTADGVRNWMIIAAVVSVVALLVILILLVMRKRIALVVQLFKEAGKAIGKMPFLLFQPLLTLVFLSASLAGMAYVFLYVWTAAIPSVNDRGWVVFTPDDLLLYLKWVYLFGVLWVVQFMFACQQLCIAGAIGSWYFSRDKSSLGWPVVRSMANLIRYHLGSAAFGAFLIALIQFLRIVLAYVQKKLAWRTGAPVQFILKCLQCCLWCFEKFLKFLNRNAYIMVAIFGHNFCKGAQRAFSLLLSNVLRVGAINSVGTFCLFLAKVGVVAIIAVTALEGFRLQDRPDLCYYWAPILISCVFAYMMSHCFLSVYGMTIDTVFLCFCEDCARNDGVQKPYFMSKGLMEYVENSKQALAALKVRELKAKLQQRRGSQAAKVGASKVQW